MYVIKDEIMLSSELGGVDIFFNKYLLLLVVLD